MSFAPTFTGPLALDLRVWPIFHRMSQRGIMVDQAKVAALLAEVQGLRQDVESRLAFNVGPDFNPASADQVAEYMDEQGLSGKRTKKKGRLMTDERSLAQHADPTLKDVLEFRGLQKLEGTFLRPLIGVECVHPKWRLTKVRSGRVAMEDPNLLAFPVREELGRKVRDAFVARPGMKMISVDYSQIEPRITAALSKDPTLLEIYRTGRDLYAETARRLFHIPPEQVVDVFKQRLPAKTTTLGVLYGIGAMKLYEQLIAVGCGEGDPLVPFFTEEQCQELIDGWFAVYPQVKALVERTVRTAYSQGGWSFTVGNRGRFLPGLFLTERRFPHAKLREESERQAFNHLIQGTAQEEMKKGMVRVDDAGLDFYPLLQIHDELIGEAPAAQAYDVAEIMVGLMETDFQGVRLKAEAKVADSWGGLKG